MEIGMLWFDNDKKSDYEAKIERAATYYRDKYGKAPNLCFVHPSTIPHDGDERVLMCGIRIKTSKTMLPNHFWIGISSYDLAGVS